jgi:hypothetical protein
MLQEEASKKGEYAPSYAKKETDVTVYGDDKPAAKKKVACLRNQQLQQNLLHLRNQRLQQKPVAPKKPVAKKVVKAVAKVKPTQPAKKQYLRQSLRDKITYCCIRQVLNVIRKQFNLQEYLLRVFKSWCY